MNISNRNIILFMGIVLAVALLLYGTNEWVESKLRSQLDEKVKEGQLKYESVSVNIFTNRASIHKPLWINYAKKTKTKEVKFQNLKISNFSYYQYFVNGSIKIGTIDVENPEVTIYPSPPDSLKSDKNRADKKKQRDIPVSY